MLSDRRIHGSKPAEQLRESLTQLENRLGKLDRSGRAEALDIPPLFDSAFALLTELQAHGASFPGEQARFETVKAIFRNKAKIFLRIVGGTPTLKRRRAMPAPDVARWWWYIDSWQAELQYAQRLRTVKLWGIAAAVLAGLIVLYITLLRPDEATRKQMLYQNTAERLAVSGDYANALTEANAALAVKPDAMELHILKGILEESLDMPQEAKQSFSRAQVLAATQETLLLERAQKYLLLGMPNRAMADTDLILIGNAESAYAYFLQAKTYESQDALAEAANAFSKAIKLAAAADQTALEATIRLQQAYLLQRIMVATP